MTVRRIVTGHGPDGKSLFVSDAPAPRETAFKHVPGFVTTLLWETKAGAGVPASASRPFGVRDVLGAAARRHQLDVHHLPARRGDDESKLRSRRCGRRVHAGASRPGREVRDGLARACTPPTRSTTPCCSTERSTWNWTTARARSLRRAMSWSRTARATRGATAATSRPPCCSCSSARPGASRVAQESLPGTTNRAAFPMGFGPALSSRAWCRARSAGFPRSIGTAITTWRRTASSRTSRSTRQS